MRRIALSMDELRALLAEQDMTDEQQVRFLQQTTKTFHETFHTKDGQKPTDWWDCVKDVCARTRGEVTKIFEAADEDIKVVMRRKPYNGHQVEVLRALRQRNVLRWRNEDHLEFSQIAERLGVSGQRVRQLHAEAEAVERRRRYREAQS